VKIHFLHVWLA